MATSFVCVILKNSEDIIIVENKWINLSMSRMFNGAGAKKFAERKIFYSPNSKDNANFNMPARDQFDGDITACYWGHCLMGFGK